MTKKEEMKFLSKMSISEQLAYLRMKLKLKNVELAVTSGVSTQHITNVQKGTRPINSTQLQDLAAAMGYTVVLVPIETDETEED